MVDVALARDRQAKISKRYPVELLTALAFFAGESGVARKWMGLAVMILSAWLIAASVIDLGQPVAVRCFYQAKIDRADCGMGPAESAHATRRSYRRPGGVYHFYSLRWIAGIVLRKEALGMGDVLPPL